MNVSQRSRYMLRNPLCRSERLQSRVLVRAFVTSHMGEVHSCGVSPLDMPPPKWGSGRRGTVQGSAAHGIIKFVIRAAPLPKPIFDFLRENITLLRRMQQERNEGYGPNRESVTGGVIESSRVETTTADDEEQEEDEVDVQGEVLKRPTVKAEDFWPTLVKMCKEAGPDWADVPEQLWAFGPQRAGTCLLVDTRAGQPTS